MHERNRHKNRETDQETVTCFSAMSPKIKGRHRKKNKKRATMHVA